ATPARTLAQLAPRRVRRRLGQSKANRPRRSRPRYGRRASPGPVGHQLDIVDVETERTVRAGCGRDAEIVDLLRVPMRGGRPWPDGHEAIERDFEGLPFRPRKERAHEVRRSLRAAA